MKRIAILISNKGTGSNLAAIITAIEKNEIKNGKIVVVVSNKADAYGLVRAKEKNIPCEVLDLKDFIKQGKTRLEYDDELGKLISEKYKPDLIVLAGWMLILSNNFIKYFPNRVINLHPGLLPDKATQGLHTDAAVGYAIDHHFPYTGSTVHFITAKVDCGPVIIRSEVKIIPNDTVGSLYERMKSEEHKILPKAIAFYCQDKLRIKNGKVTILRERKR